MSRRFTFGSDPATDFRSENESMMGEDFDQLRQRFNQSARNFRQNNGFDRWFEQPEDAFPQPRFKIPKEDERSAYVRNIPIFQAEENENLMRQNNSSSIPKPVPPQTQKTSSPPPPPPQPSFKTKASARATSSSASDSGIERSSEGSPRNSTESVASASAFTSSLPGKEATAAASAFTFSPKASFTDSPEFKKPKDEKEKVIPIKLDGTAKVKASASGSAPIPMGYLPRQRDPKEPIPMGFERPASAPGERVLPPSTSTEQPPKATPSSNGVDTSEKVHRVPIAVREDLQRSSSAPPKRSETSPPLPKPKSPLEKINDINSHVQTLHVRIEMFTGVKKDHEYRLLDELLTQSMIKLDAVEPEGVEEIRMARRNAIKKVEDLTVLLESKGRKPSEPLASAPIATTRILISMNPENDKNGGQESSPGNKKIQTEI